MADELDKHLDSIIERAPLTPQIGDDNFEENVLPASKEPVKQADQQTEVKTEVKVEEKKPEDENDIEVIRKRLADFEKKYTDKDGMAAAERAKRREAEARAQQLEDNFRMLQQQIAAQQARQRNSQFKVPDPEENVVEAVKYERMLRMAQEQQQQKAMQAQQQQMEQLNYVNRLKTGVEDLEAEFREKNPDYDEHADFLVDFEQQRLEMMGWPKDQAEQMAINWAINAADNMMRRGVNPAQAAYEQAKKMGFKPKAAAEAEKQAAAQAAQQAAAQANLQQKKSGQAAAATISGGGAQGGEDNSLAAIANLRGAAFDSAVEKMLRGNR